MSVESFKRNEFLAGVFNRCASKYCSIGPEYFSYFGKRLVDNAQIFAGARVLDIACGRGASLFPASLKTGDTGHATGIDFSENMISETQTVIFEQGYKNIDVIQMNAEELSFEDDSFDFILCGLSMQFFSKYDMALREMFRVLKPGGKIGIATWKKKDKPPIIAKVISKYLQPSPANQNTIPRPDFGTIESLDSMLAQAGFYNIKISEESKQFYYKDEETWWLEQWSHSGRAPFEMIEKMGTDVLNNFKKDIFNELQKDENEIPFDAVALFSYAEK